MTEKDVVIGKINIEDSEEMIVGIEVESATNLSGGRKDIMTLKITTDNHGTSFILDYETGKFLKVGDRIKVNKTIICD